MRRPARILLNAAAGLSLLLRVTSVAFWATTYRTGWYAESHHYHMSNPNTFARDEWWVHVGAGGLSWCTSYLRSTSPEALRFGRLPPDRHGKSFPTSRPVSFRTNFNRGFELAPTLGFAVHRYVTLPGQPGKDLNYRGVSNALAVPFWAPAFLFAAIAALTRRAARCPRTSPALCPACGYDLRATPERCPECGTIPPLSATSGSC